MFIKKVVLLLTIFLIAFTTQIQEKEPANTGTLVFSAGNHIIEVAQEECLLPENPD